MTFLRSGKNVHSALMKFFVSDGPIDPGRWSSVDRRVLFLAKGVNAGNGSDKNWSLPKTIRCKWEGGPSSDDDNLKIYVDEDRDLLERQVNYLNPEFVVCCNTWHLVKAIWPDAKEISELVPKIDKMLCVEILASCKSVPRCDELLHRIGIASASTLNQYFLTNSLPAAA